MGHYNKTSGNEMTSIIVALYKKVSQPLPPNASPVAPHIDISQILFRIILIRIKGEMK